MNNKGQALVEFVLILPIFIFLLFIIIDFGIIFNEKNKLENVSLDIINFYNKGMDISDIEEMYKDITITSNLEEEYYHIIISKKVKLRNIGLGKIFGNPYKITVERMVPYV